MKDVGHFTFPAIAESLSAARNCVRGIMQGANRSDKELDVNIVVGEVLQNVVRYGFDGGNPDGQFTIGFLVSETDLEIVITDNAPPSDPQTWTNDHRAPEEGGHGLNLVNAITKEARFEMLDDGNRAVLKFHFASTDT